MSSTTRLESLAPPARGQLYWVESEPGRGSEQRGRRPSPIVQCDPFNRNRRYTNTIIVAISTAGHPVPVHVTIGPSQSNGLPQRSYVHCEQLMTVSRERLVAYIGEVDADTMARVDHALKPEQRRGQIGFVL